ncbi:hypothetical protein Tco_1558325, partial [Tanacetum coccineum]
MSMPGLNTLSLFPKGDDNKVAISDDSSGIFFNQLKYIKEMLKKFGLEDSKLMKTPMSTETKLTRDEEGESVDNTKYRGMIDGLSTIEYGPYASIPGNVKVGAIKLTLI